MIKVNDIVNYELNKEDHTAKVCHSECFCHIRRSVMFDSEEYFVTGIKEGSLINDTMIDEHYVEFNDDVIISSLEKNIFINCAYVNRLYIPPSIKELKDGWCSNTPALNLVEISPKNKNFTYIDDMIVGKSNPESEVFDVILFSLREILKVRIPPFIKRISPFCFEYCRNISTIEFSKNSELCSIGYNAFSNSSIEYLSIPPQLKELEDGWCANTPNLFYVSVSSQNKNFQIIDDKLLIGKSDVNSKIFDTLRFACRDIEHVKIPSYIKHISKYCFQDCKELEKIEIDENSELSTISDGTFYKSSLEYLYLPANLKELKNGWCEQTSKLVDISISPKNKNFKIIDEKLLIGKSNPKNKNFDILYFACRDVDKVIIPSYIKHISPFCFQKCTYLKSIEFAPNSRLLTIGKYAFSNSSIESIKIPSSCQQIGEYSFYKCKLFTRIEFDVKSELKLIGDGCFIKTQLMSIQIPDNVTEIGKDAFYKCDTLTRVIFSNNSKLNTIGDQAFSQSSIIEITIPKHVKHIPRKAFYHCIYLEKVEFNEDSELISIEEISFCESSIQSIEIPSRTKIIQMNAFSFCENLQNVKFKQNSELFYIGKEAFFNTGIKKFVIPSSVKFFEEFYNSQNMEIEYEKNSQIASIGSHSINEKENSLYIADNIKYFDTYFFNYCFISRLNISPNNKNFKIINQKMVAGKSNLNNKEFDVLFFACHDITEAIIPSYIKYIGEKSFSRCEKLKSVKFSANSELIKIEEYAFCNSGIESISLPNHVKTIGKNAFEKCSKLKKIEISENSELEFIDKDAFVDSSLKRIFLPKNLNANSFGLFCKHLNHITISTKSQNFKLIDNMIVSKSELNSKTYDILNFVQHDVEQVKIPSYIKYISAYCFYKCNKLKSVMFDSKSQLVEIGEFSFSNTSIDSIVLPIHLKKICESAFENTTKLNKIVFPENSEIEFIGMSAFKNSSIISLIFPDNLTKIKPYAFFKCKKLTNVEFSKKSKLIKIRENTFNGTSISKITIPSSVIVIKDDAFANCSKLKTVIFDKNSKLKQISRGAFENTSIEKIIIPSEVEHIGSSSFLQCSKLKNVTFEPNSKLKYIGKGAFTTTSITKIKIPANVNHIDIECFYNSNLQEIEYEKDSKLASIAINSFPNSENIKVKIPSNVDFINTDLSYSQNISNIAISPSNKYFKSIGNDLVAKKSNINSDKYETLDFALIQIKNAKIPSYIKYISPYCFKCCDQLTKIEFPKDSNLRRIGNCSFEELSIEKITIPSHVKYIKKLFLNCDNLKNVDFGANSELKVIGKDSFNSESIECISIPKNVTKIKDGWCPFAPNLINVKISQENKNFKIINGKLLIGKSNPKYEKFDVLLLAFRDIEKVIIPSYIRYISSYCFKDCQKIKTIEFAANSELVSIGKYAFSDSSIEHISIPENCERIGKFCFNNTNKLIKVEFPLHSKIEIIPSNTFCCSYIKDITFPSSVSMLQKESFYKCENLKNVRFLGNFICIHTNSFKECSNLMVLEFPNAKKIHYHKEAFEDQSSIQILLKNNI